MFSRQTLASILEEDPGIETSQRYEEKYKQ